MNNPNDVMFRDQLRAHRRYLESLANYLIQPLIAERNSEAGANNYNGVHSHILDSIRRFGHNIHKTIQRRSIYILKKLLLKYIVYILKYYN